jgi:hypothetical protein
MVPLHYMELMTYPQVEQLATRAELALLPVGPPEAHGPHLPLGTDFLAARELCERAGFELSPAPSRSGRRSWRPLWKTSVEGWLVRASGGPS